MAGYIKTYSRTWLFVLLACSFLVGCGASTPTISTKSPPTTDATRYIDWNQLDWKFQRHTFASAYMFEQDHPRSSYDIYQKATQYDGPVKPVTLSEFQSLPAKAQNSRRIVAAARLNDAMAFHRIIMRSWEIWLYSRTTAVAQEAFRYEHGLVAHTLQNLETAAGLDPSNPFTWYHLSFFSGLVGDRTRQLEALNTGLSALPAYQDNGSSTELIGLRMLLDKSWLLRDTGHFPEGQECVNDAIRVMAQDDQRTLDLAREALLLQALLEVDLGDIHQARSLARELESWDLPLQKTPAQSVTSASVSLHKNNLEHIESDFCRQWVWAMTYLKQRDSRQALAYINKQKWVTEFPAHLNYRLWQDMGRIQESFGQWNEAKTSYGFAILYRPFFPFYPMQGARGLSRVFGQTSTGYTYYLGYGSMFLAGSYYSFAANRVIALEAAQSPAEKSRHGQDAIDALTTCIKQENRLASALALRGRVHYRLDNFTEAEADLHHARQLMKAQGQESSDVVMLLAVLHFDRQDYLGSLDLLSTYQKLKPRDGFGWRLSGLALAHLNRFEEALVAQNHALELDPRAAPGWYNRALVHLQLGEVELARADLKQARKLMPGNKDINRVSMLISADPQTQIHIKSEPIVLGISRRDSLLYRQSSMAATANLAVNLSPGALEKMLKKLELEYETDPTVEQRLLLGRTLIQAGRMPEVQELLTPLWPDQLTREEMDLLLRSDRALGHPARAITLARSLKTNTNPLLYSDFWALVAIICIENGAGQSGNMALDMALELNPENMALLQLRGYSQ